MKNLLRGLVMGAIVLIMSAPLTATAQTTAPAMTKASVTAALPKLEQYIQDEMKRTGVPGLSIGIVYDDEVVYLKGFGVREAGKPETVDADTAFQLASVSKPLGSTVIASLISDGLVSWDSKISDLDPSFRLMDAYPTSQLTLRDTYAHRSGLPGPAGTELELMGYDRAAILHALRFVKPSGSFRAGYSYSDFVMTEGGEAAVKPTGKTWQEVSQERLYTPLGMTHTSSLNADFLKETNRAKLHVLLNGKMTFVEERQPDPQSPAGGASSSAHDMAEWMRLVLGNGTYNGKEVIKPEALAQSFVPVMSRGFTPALGNPSFYGQGWNIEFENGHTILDHAGAFTTGAHTLVRLSPSEKVGVVVLSNSFPGGLPEAITYTFYDLARTGQSVRDWSAFWDKNFNSLYGPESYAAYVAKFSAPPANVSPALANAAYIGNYGNSYIPDVHIVEQNGGLVLQLGPAKMAYPLKHWDRDVFLYYSDMEVPTYPSLLFINIDAAGKASQLTIQDIVNVGGDGIVTRVADEP